MLVRSTPWLKAVVLPLGLLLCLVVPGVAQGLGNRPIPCRVWLEGLRNQTIQKVVQGIPVVGVLNRDDLDLFRQAGWQRKSWFELVRDGSSILVIPAPTEKIPSLWVAPRVWDSSQDAVFGILDQYRMGRGAPYEGVDSLYFIDSGVIGDLSAAEVASIQQVVDGAQTPVWVFGSAVRSERRNRGTDLELGKGPNQRSDIDYLIPWPWSLKPESRNVLRQLPDFDGRTLGAQHPSRPIVPSVLFFPQTEPIHLTVGSVPESIELDNKPAPELFR